jgi:putative MATE family efflux protein
MKKWIQLFWLAVKGTNEEFTSGSIRRAIFLLSIPMVLEMLMESLFAVVDIFFVSKIGVNAVATIGLTETVFMLIISVAVGISMAATAMVARRIGEKDPERASVAAGQAIILGVIISVMTGVAGVIWAADILRLMGGPGDLVAEGVNYTRIMMGGNVTIMLLFILNAIYRGAGDASMAMRSLWLANGINIVLDPCLIFGLGPFPELGLTGAAIATNIGRGVGVLFQLYFLFNGKRIIQLAARHFLVRWHLIVSQVKIASGGTSQFLIASASWIILMRFIAEYGSEALAGYTIAIRIIIFTILPSWGMANAAATLVGQNLGAKNPDRAEKSVWLTARYNFFFLLTVSVLFFAFAPQLIGIFNTNGAVVDMGVMALRIICVGYGFYAYGMVVSQAFNGAGDTFTPTWINFVSFWLLEIPLAYYAAFYMGYGPAGIFIAVAVAESFMALLCILIFRRGKWKTVEV